MPEYLMYKYRSMFSCVLLVLLLNGCNQLEEDLQPLDTAPEEVENESDDKNNEPKETFQNIEKETISDTDNTQSLEAAQDSAGVIIAVEVTPEQNNSIEEKNDAEIAQQNTPSASPDHDESTTQNDTTPVEVATAPETSNDNVFVDYDVARYESLNLAINALAKKEYTIIEQLDHVENFLVSPAITFTMASFLEHSAAGISKTQIQEGLDWSTERDWPLSSWYRLVTNPFETSQSSFNSQAWGKTDYLFSENYLLSLSTIFYTDMDKLETTGVEQWMYDHTIDVEVLNSSILIPGEVNSSVPQMFPYDESEIQDAINSLSERTRLMFASSLLIDTTWSEDASHVVQIEGFWGVNDDVVKMPMVKWQGTFRRHDTDDYRAVIIPLTDQATSLTVIMPVSSESFDRVEPNVFDALAEIEQSQKMVAMEFVLPHFSVQTGSFATKLIPAGRYQAEPEETTQTPDSSAPLLPVLLNGERIIYETSDYSTVNDAGYLKRNFLGGLHS